MAATPTTPIKVVFGAMTFGAKGVEQARVHTIPECAAILDIFQSHGHKEIDTARTYCDGTSESLLGDLDWQSRGLIMQTKYYPTGNKPSIAPPNSPEGGWLHTPEHLRENLLASLKALKCEKIDMWYLHGPDRTTPYETTLRTVNDLYLEGRFSRFGLSNFAAWEVAQICEICTRNGWVKPSVYQGVYNALRRDVETDLFPCLRYYDVAFYVFNPLAGGLLTSRYHRSSLAPGGEAEGKREEEGVEAGSRFDPTKVQGKQYRARYWNDAYFDALEILREVAGRFGLSEAECALRWLNHHSVLKREKGDAIIIGASSVKHIDENLRFLEDGRPLPEEVVEALEKGWKRVKGVSASYFH